MAMPVSVPTYTVDDLERFPDDGNRYELLDGVLLVTPLAELPHQLVTGRLLARLAELVRPWPDVFVTSPGVVRLRPKTQLGPDILVFRRPVGPIKWDNVRENLLAVETASPSTVVYDRDFKRPAYLGLGAHEVWRVDTDARAVLVSLPGHPPDQPHHDLLDWTPKGLGPTFRIDIEPLFRGLD
jgi:Uma2 family endonuclease